MKSIAIYLDKAKEITGSDYATSKKIGVDRAAISMMRKSLKISDENAVKLAELLGIDAAEVLLAAALARSQGSVKKAWEELGKRAGIAASVLLAVVLVTIQHEEKADNQFYTIAIMRSFGRCIDELLPRTVAVSALCFLG